MTDLEVMPPDDMPARATVLQERDHVPLMYAVRNATSDTSILLDCPNCTTRIRLGPCTGPYQMNLPWLSSLCPSCGARFSVVQRIEITWQPGRESASE
jgi:hypothetical protein